MPFLILILCIIGGLGPTDDGWSQPVGRIRPVTYSVETAKLKNKPVKIRALFITVLSLFFILYSLFKQYYNSFYSHLWTICNLATGLPMYG